MTNLAILSNLTILSKQRGHGGGGGVLTASNQIEGNPAFHNDWQYKVTPLIAIASRKSSDITQSKDEPSVFLADLCNKVLGQISDRVNQVAVAFMLGHDYGFKRIMSSYYFQDTDQVLNNQQKSCFKSSNMIIVLAGPTWRSACLIPKCLRQRVDL